MAGDGSVTVDGVNLQTVTSMTCHMGKDRSDMFSTGLIQSSESLERDGSRFKLGWYDDGAGTMMEDGRVEDFITSDHKKTYDEDCSNGMLLEDGCNGYESVGARKVMEETALAQASPIDPNVFVDGNSDPTVMDAASDPTSPLLSMVMHAKSVDGNSNHGHAQIKGDYFPATRIDSCW
ncbi:hypothetical protein L2E82_35405 [Cichorium intybus]|uniref:Uncharacterized protein n=1 Tax=Cichorium intybus TaxID=13427 RepID=A0ACB9BNQ0_CICIN|nr:hypothetical protein L2E82_35405 [Cichorium intybus]